MQSELYTYSLPRPFFGLNIPIAIQSVYLRNYAHSRDFTFVLPKVEWFLPNTYIELFKLLQDDSVHHLGMSSLRMLPLNEQYLKSMLPSRDLIFHFILENKVIVSSELLDYIMEYKLINSLASRKHKFLL